jgi:riboflavin kinase/FMN adenylyltransferase
MLLTGPFDGWVAAPTARAVTIGVFDGVHRGHKYVFRQLAAAAAGRGLRITVVTFDRHPRQLVTPGDVPALINTNQERLALLEDADVDDVAVLSFDDTLRNMSAGEFSERVLREALGSELVVVGAGFRFGRGGRGDIGELSKLGGRHGYDVHVAEILVENGAPISSSQIRAMVSDGDVEGSEALLGRHFTRSGVVVPGDQRGALVGFPTANLQIEPDLLLPGNGVYVGYAFVDGESWETVVNVGTRPTFAGNRLTVEAHLLDFSGDLYGIELTLEFRLRLRSEIRFSGPEELTEQIRRDIERARAFFNSGARAQP